MVSYFLTFIVFTITLTLVLLASNITKAKADCPTNYVTLESANGFTFSSGTAAQKICYCAQAGKSYFSVADNDACFK